jgi:hypothetical protein
VLALTVFSACGPITGQRPFLAADADALYLPAPAEGQATRSRLTLYNLGGSELLLTRVAVAPAGGAWSVEQPTWPRIPADGALELVIRFRPGPQDLGPQQARLVLSSNDPQQPELTIPLHALTTSPNLSATPSRVDFGAVASGKTSMQLVTVQNIGRATARALELVFPANGKSDFSADLTAGVLAPGGTSILRVSYAPRGGGGDQTTLTLRWQGSSATRSLRLPLTGRQDLKAPD